MAKSRKSTGPTLHTSTKTKPARSERIWQSVKSYTEILLVTAICVGSNLDSSSDSH